MNLNTSIRRVIRLLLGFVLPPVVAVLIVESPLIFSLVIDYPMSALKWLIDGIMLAFLVVGIPSAIYSSLMEFVVRKRVQHRWKSVLVSTLLGTLVGVALSIVLMVATEETDLGLFVLFTLLGALVGLIVGWLLSLIKDENDASTTP